MTTAEPLPSKLPVGTAIRCTVENEPAVIVGAAPAGLPVILSPGDWDTLTRWKLTRLAVVSGRVVADVGNRSRPLVARFITSVPRNTLIVYRNGNALDLRRSNLALIPRGLLVQAAKEADEPPERPAFVVLRNGRIRTPRKRALPPAKERIATLLNEQITEPR
jgi:hypothetical protein